MAESTSLPIPRTTSPLYGAQAGELAGQLATLSTEELAKILRVNHRIAATNRLRYSRFHDDAERALPALAAYTGIVFKRIAPADFTAGDFEYAQAHLNITSFLYGLLRPLDAIRTYRLEGDAVLPGHGEQTVFEYWQDKLTDAFLEKITVEDWRECVETLAEMTDIPEMEKFCRDGRPLFERYPVYGDILEQTFLERRLSRGLLDPAQLTALLGRYCQCVTDAARPLYREDVLQNGDAYALPSRLRFALKIQKALDCMAEENYRESIPPVQEALRARRLKL